MTDNQTPVGVRPTWCCWAPNAARCDAPAVSERFDQTYGPLPICDQHAVDRRSQQLTDTVLLPEGWAPRPWRWGPQGAPQPGDWPTDGTADSS